MVRSSSPTLAATWRFDRIELRRRGGIRAAPPRAGPLPRPSWRDRRASRPPRTSRARSAILYSGAVGIVLHRLAVVLDRGVPVAGPRGRLPVETRGSQRTRPATIVRLTTTDSTTDPLGSEDCHRDRTLQCLVMLACHLPVKRNRLPPAPVEIRHLDRLACRSSEFGTGRRSPVLRRRRVGRRPSLSTAIFVPSAFSTRPMNFNEIGGGGGGPLGTTGVFRWRPGVALAALGVADGGRREPWASKPKGIPSRDLPGSVVSARAPRD